jgi:hypothetical protein
MLDWLRRRRVSPRANKKLLIAAARAEEALIETHVLNMLDFLDVLGDEVDVERAVELYLDRVPVHESLASAVTNRLLARLDGSAAPHATKESRFRHIFRDG